MAYILTIVRIRATGAKRTATGSRFHPIEIGLSMLSKFGTITVLGPPVVAVVIFEVLLNATPLFNHGNVSLPAGVDRVLRWFVVTPDMHRVHHSVEDDETNSNFGFNLPWWDRLFGTYHLPRPAARGHEAMMIRIHGHRDLHEVVRLGAMLALRWLFALALLGLVAAAWTFRDPFDAGALQAWVERAVAAGPVIFIAIYAAATVLLLPGAVVTLAVVALFGPV